MRGADLLVRSLAAAGVTRIFSLSGNQIMPVYDACIDAGIAIVHTRHEAAAVFMAEAWAQLTGGIGVALCTAAPGAMNALGPIYDAARSETPVLFLTGDSARSQDGRGAFQELDQVAVTAPLTKLSLRIESVDSFGRSAALAIRTALSGRPGPVHLALPFDLLEATVDGFDPPDATAFAPLDRPPEPRDVSAVAAAIAGAARPLVVTGPSSNRTRFGQGLAAASAALGFPVLAMESPRGLKDPSLGSIASLLAQADLVVSLGKPIDFSLGFGRTVSGECRWILVDCDEAEHRRARLNLGERLLLSIDAEPRPFCAALASALGGARDRSDWRLAIAHAIAARVTPGPEMIGGRVSPAALCQAVQRQVERAGESVVICDGGEFGQWSQAFTGGTHRIINGPSGAIGGGLCYALAAKQAKPLATVFALMGDGSAGFHFAEFETAARVGAPFVAVIGNDRCWNAEHQIQLREYGRERLIGCMLSDARYDLAVAALGGHGEHVTEAAALPAALARAVASGKVACVNVAIEGLPAPSGSGH